MAIIQTNGAQRSQDQSGRASIAGVSVQFHSCRGEAIRALEKLQHGATGTAVGEASEAAEAPTEVEVRTAGDCGVDNEETWEESVPRMESRQAIEDEEAGKINVFELRPLTELRNEYKGSSDMRRRIEDLGQLMAGWRKIRGDGNCYYRSLIFAFLEYCIAHGCLDRLRALRDQLLELSKEAGPEKQMIHNAAVHCRKLLLGLITQRVKFGNLAALQDQLADLHRSFQRHQNDWALIYCLRHLVARYLKRNRSQSALEGLTWEDYAHALGGLDECCATFICKMGEDARDLVVAACPLVLGINTQICHVETSGRRIADTATLYHNFPPNHVPEVFLLFKPGHYEVLVPFSDRTLATCYNLPPVASLPNNAATIALEWLESTLIKEYEEQQRRHPRGADELQLLQVEVASIGGSELLPKLATFLESPPPTQVQHDDASGGLQGTTVPFLPPPRTGEEASRRQAEELVAQTTEAFAQSTDSANKACNMAVALLQDSLVTAFRQHPPSHAELDVLRPKVDSVAESLKHSFGSPASLSDLRDLLISLRQECQLPAAPPLLMAEQDLSRAPVVVPTTVLQLPQQQQSSQTSLQVAAPSPRGMCPVCAAAGGTATAHCGCTFHLPCLQGLLEGEQVAVHRVQCPQHRRDFGVSFLESAFAETATESPPPPPPPPPPPVPIVPRQCDAPVLCGSCHKEVGEKRMLANCRHSVHPNCLSGHWMARAEAMQRVTDIGCPVEGCTAMLLDSDLERVVSPELRAQVVSGIEAAERELQRVLAESRPPPGPLPRFRCEICIEDKQVDGSYTLPCNDSHRVCQSCLGKWFDGQVDSKDELLKSLRCPLSNCKMPIDPAEHIEMFRSCMSKDKFERLDTWLLHISTVQCNHPSCEERVVVEVGDDATDLRCQQGHGFCRDCQNGPHGGRTCQVRASEILQQEVDHQDDTVWEVELKNYWRPCPKRCKHGGAVKDVVDCDHMTCKCGHEFCWRCGMDRHVTLAHDLRWHKPSCKYYTAPDKVDVKKDPPQWKAKCPECKKRPEGQPCSFPMDDDYPASFLPPRAQDVLKRLPKKEREDYKRGEKKDTGSSASSGA